jgi:selenide,water dikinase
LCDIPKNEDPALIVGYETSDDAAVYQLDDKTGLIQTLDFFTPIVDDPYDFGQIAAANALSDVYAMGGIPKVAMNIVCFPNCLDTLILKEILRGGAEKVKEAGAVLAGGHSIEDNEPKYGLSVTGFVDPNRIWQNAGAKVGDVIILTKPLGMGVLTTALKEGMVEEDTIAEITRIMGTLNKYAAEAVNAFDIHACTDITGFGLLGHALEMAEGSHVTLDIELSSIPYVKAALPLAEMGIIPAGAYRNQAHVMPKTAFIGTLPVPLMDLCYDPQTSGGLLISLPESQANAALQALEGALDVPFAKIGKVTALGVHALVIRP